MLAASTDWRRSPSTSVLARLALATLALAVGAFSCRKEKEKEKETPRVPTPLTPAAAADVGAAAVGAEAAEVDQDRPPPSPAASWARWPMPTPVGAGLPHPASYDLRTAGVVLDRVTGLMWQRAVDPKSYSWRAAIDHCQGLTLAGHDDWRLPSRLELVSIVDLTRVQPTIDEAAFPGTPSDWFWSGSVEAVNPKSGAAWYVYFFFGYPKTDLMNTPYRARCVRTANGPGGEVPLAQLGRPGAPPYLVETDVVHDRGTGLTWQRVVSQKPFAFDDARRHCATLRLDNKKGWRVPTMGELQTLIDERTANPTIDGQAFPNTPGGSFWTASRFAGSPAMAWYLNFEHGDALYGLLKVAYRVRCVQ